MHEKHMEIIDDTTVNLGTVITNAGVVTFHEGKGKDSFFLSRRRENMGIV